MMRGRGRLVGLTVAVAAVAATGTTSMVIASRTHAPIARPNRTKPTAKATPSPTPPPAPTATPTPSPVVATPLAVVPTPAPTAPPPPPTPAPTSLRGHLVTTTLAGHSVIVYVPGAYAALPATRLGVVYFLHGSPGNAESWITGGNMPAMPRRAAPRVRYSESMVGTRV
ncbi:MAG TPA: hypothetical protein VF112_03835, partial [Candidatus Dormibacteraeota bacterium]